MSSWIVIDAGLARAALHTLDLVLLAVDEHDPATLPLRVATQPLGERIVDDLLGTVLDARPHALVDRAGLLGVALLSVVQAVQHVGDRAAPQRQRVDRRDLRHPLRFDFSPFGQA